MLGVKPIDVYILVAISVASLNFLKSIPACISPGKGKNGSTVAVSAELNSQVLSFPIFPNYIFTLILLSGLFNIFFCLNQTLPSVILYFDYVIMLSHTQ